MTPLVHSVTYLFYWDSQVCCKIYSFCLLFSPLPLVAHLAVFLNYLISDSSNNPSSLVCSSSCCRVSECDVVAFPQLFYLVSGVYQRHQVSKELKRMANDLYQTFFVSTAVSCVLCALANGDHGVLHIACCFPSIPLLCWRISCCEFMRQSKQC